MTRDERLELAAKVGHAFTAREMRAHLPPLRAYYVDVRAGRKPRTWPDELVIDWAIALQVPPFERAAEVRPMCSSCGCNERHDSQRPMVFPGGWLVTCLACGRRWLELQADRSLGKACF